MTEFEPQAYTQAWYQDHGPDCLCGKCCEADMNAFLRAQGINPDKYNDRRNGEDVTAVRTRYAKPGTSCGNGVVRTVSAAQVRYIKGLMAERDTTNLVRLPGSEDIENMSLRGARDLIDRLLACPRAQVERMATEGQKRFLFSLAAQKGIVIPPESEWSSPMTFKQISAHLDRLKALPNKMDIEVEAGIYLVDGVVHKVQRAVHGSGKLYAKVLVDGVFQYAPGALKNVRPEHRMTLEQAKEYGALYGVCCNCGRTLTDEKSIEAAIGPVCAKKFR